MIAVLIGSGAYSDASFYKNYINGLSGEIKIICADGGISLAHELNLSPCLIVGDFDSCDLNILSVYEQNGINIKRFDVKKDYTDMELALFEALLMNPDEIIIFGGLGSRLDHSIANVYLLQNAVEKGIDARIVNEKNEIFLINRDKCFRSKKGEIVSLIPITDEVIGVCTKKLEYALNDATLLRKRAYGLSNVAEADNFTIMLKTGLLLVIKATD